LCADLGARRTPSRSPAAWARWEQRLAPLGRNGTPVPARRAFYEPASPRRARSSASRVCTATCGPRRRGRDRGRKALEPRPPAARGGRFSAAAIAEFAKNGPGVLTYRPGFGSIRGLSRPSRLKRRLSAQSSSPAGEPTRRPSRLRRPRAAGAARTPAFVFRRRVGDIGCFEVCR